MRDFRSASAMTPAPFWTDAADDPKLKANSLAATAACAPDLNHADI